MDYHSTWYASRHRPGRLCVRRGPSYSQKKGHNHPTQFLAHVYCGQTAGWMKTPLGTKVDLGPGYIVLDRGPGFRKRGTAAPTLFGPCLLWLRSHISATAELLSPLPIHALVATISSSSSSSGASLTGHSRLHELTPLGTFLRTLPRRVATI